MGTISVSKPNTVRQLTEVIEGAVAEEAALSITGTGSKLNLGRPMDVTREIQLTSLAGVGLYEPEELVITVAAGTAVEEIKRVTAEYGQELAFEPPDIGPIIGEESGSGTIGGAIACNLSGPRRIKVGAARDHILGFRSINGLAKTFKSGGRVVKNVTGYDLSKLMAGSWGTLGVMTEITLKVLPIAETVSTIVVYGLDDAAGIGLLTKALQSPNDISGAAHLPTRIASCSGVLSAADSITMLRVEGPDPSVRYRVDKIIRLAEEYCGSHGDQVIKSLDKEISLSLWKEIRDVSYFLGSKNPLWRLSVEPSKGPQIITSIAKVLTNIDYYFDLGGGLVWLSVEPDVDACATAIRSVIEEAGGHGTLYRASKETRGRVPVFHPLNPVLDQLNKRIKVSFDPLGILNPGRMYLGV